MFTQLDSKNLQPGSQPEPPGGLALIEAAHTYCDPALVVSGEEAWEAPGARNRRFVRGSTEWRAKKRAEAASLALFHDLRTQHWEGKLIAWGMVGSPLAERQRLQTHAWHYIVPHGLHASTLKSADGQVIYAVRVHSRECVLEWGGGLTLARAAELLAPESWAEYGRNYTGCVAIGDARSEAESSRALAALKRVRDTLWSAIDDGSLELRSLHPQGDPRAVWTLLSPDVLSAQRRHKLNFRDSMLMDTFGVWREVRMFPVGARRNMEAPEVSPITGVPKLGRKTPIYSRVSVALELLSDTALQLVKTRGGKKKLAEIMQADYLPDVPLASIERELRRRLRDLANSEKKAGN